MNEHTLGILEYGKLLATIAEQAQSRAGVKLLLALKPLSVLEKIEERRALYRDMTALRNVPLEFPPLQMNDLEEAMRQVTPQGAVLDGAQLVSFLRLLECAQQVREFVFGKDCTDFLVLRQTAEPLDGCLDLASELGRSLDHDGSVLDSASEKLRELRRIQSTLEQRIQRHLEGMLRGGGEDTLQERFVTIREGRYVIPVKRDARRNVPGIVHDMSNTGQTLFIEPMETHELGNELSKARLEERGEILRILGKLSESVRQCLPAIRQDVSILTRLDAACAVARWGNRMGCEYPQFGKGLIVQNGRHPLLQLQFQAEGQGHQVVPLNLELSPVVKCLVITGSNTGGKTVVLRTVGLLCLMAQSGLPVPAGAGSQFPVYEEIFGDIGDEQSIQANLSTFSAHITNIAAILKGCRRGRSLVLLDEIGGGTDPVEGGAIACGILGVLAKMNALTLVTTHLALVKNYVHGRRDMQNASVRFNVQSLQPEYILDVGRPGASHAMLIARRLGMSQDVLEQAQQMLSQDQVKLEEVLSRMEHDQHRLAASARRAEATENELTAKRNALRKELEELRDQRRQMLMEAHRQADALVDNTRRDMENLLRSIREAAPKGNHLEPSKSCVAKEAEQARAALAEKKKKIQAGLKIHGEKPREPLKPEGIQVGLRVWVDKMQSHGVIEKLSANGSRATVRINDILVSVKATDLEASRDGKTRETQKQVIKVSCVHATGNTSTELNLVGQRVADALDILDAFLDRSVLARMPEVRIIHGFGALRNGVLEWLAKSPLVREYAVVQSADDPGKGGCTVVKL